MPTLTKRQYPGKIINAEGKHVYPGIIAPNSTLGLVEIDGRGSSLRMKMKWEKCYHTFEV